MKLMAVSIGMALLFMLAVTAVMARDWGQWAQVDPEQRQFYDGLRNSNGMQCCHSNDGYDARWETRGGEYWVEIELEWTRVPSAALLTVPNKYGVAKVWYNKPPNGGKPVIACFLPGTMS